MQKERKPHQNKIPVGPVKTKMLRTVEQETRLRACKKIVKLLLKAATGLSGAKFEKYMRYLVTSKIDTDQLIEMGLDIPED